MPVGIARAVALQPRTVVADEDPFTLAARALERLDEVSRGLPPSPRVLVGGDLPSSSEPEIARFLGPGVALERVHASKGGLGSTLGEPPAGVRVVWVRWGDPSGAGPTAFPPAAVALSVGSDAGLPPIPEAEDGSLVGPLLRSGREGTVSDPGRWIGDFAFPEPGVASGVPVRRPELPPEGPVSQGAYVPRARYLESVAARWRFVGERCGSCGRVSFPARGRCPGCETTSGLEPFPLPLDGGTVVAVTTIGAGGQPTEFDFQVAASGPYSVVLVDLLPGVRATLQVSGASGTPLRIGDRVATRLRRLYPMEGEWRYGRKAVPAG